LPVLTSDSAKCSATSRITAAANRNSATTVSRRPRRDSVPIAADGPIRSGSEAGALEMRKV
jgi:hypothetical protein